MLALFGFHLLIFMHILYCEIIRPHLSPLWFLCACTGCVCLHLSICLHFSQHMCNFLKSFVSFSKFKRSTKPLNRFLLHCLLLPICIVWWCLCCIISVNHILCAVLAKRSATILHLFHATNSTCIRTFLSNFFPTPTCIAYFAQCSLFFCRFSFEKCINFLSFSKLFSKSSDGRPDDCGREQRAKVSALI